MKNLYAEISPIKPDGTITTVRICSSRVGPKTTHQDGYIWLPLITAYPTFDINLTSNGLLDQISISYGDISFNVSAVFQNEEWSEYDWTGALARLWWGEADADFSTYQQIFEGSVSALSREAFTATVTLLGTEAGVATNLLYDAYEGIGGPEGPASLKGTLKPWASGFCQNVSPVLVDPVYWAYQVHGYGPINDIPEVYEFAQSLGDPAATVSTYAELIALDLSEAQWAKAPAIGMFRLGGQPSQKLTCDVEGALDSSTYPTSVSSIIEHLIKAVAPSASFGDMSVFDDVDWCFYTTTQVTLGDIVRQAAYQAGGYLFPDGLGVWQIGDYFAPKASGTLSTERDNEPLVISIKELTSGGPVYKVRVGHSRCWSTHSDSEISAAILEIGENADALAADAEAAREAAEQAQADLVVARNRLDAMSADGVLDRSEKKYWATQYSTLYAEKEQLLGEATGFADVEAEKEDLVSAWTDLDTYLASLDPAWDDMTQDTAIDRPAFKAAWDAVYVARWQLNASMSVKAADRAVWDFVADPNGTKPENNATVGAPVGTNIGDKPVEDVLSDIEYLLSNGGVPPSVLAPSLMAKIDLLPIRATEGIAGNYIAINNLSSSTDERFDQEQVDRTELRTQIDDNYAEFVEENAARQNQTTAVANRVTTLTTRVGDAETAITDEVQARSDAVSAVAGSVTELTTRMGDAEGAIIDEAQARSDNISSVLSQHNTLKGRVDTAEGTIISDRDASVERDNVLTSTTNAIVSRLNNVNGSGQTLEARVVNLNQAITDESGARASAITQVTSDFNGQISGVTNSITSVSNRVGSVENQATIRLDANGKVASVGLINGTNISSEFGVLADRFIVFDGSGNGTSPFFVSGGQTYIQNAVVPNLSIGTAKIGEDAITIPQTLSFSDVTLTATISVSSGGYVYVGYPNGDYMLDYEMFGGYYYVGSGSGDYIYSTETTYSGGQTVFETGWITVGAGDVPGACMLTLYATMNGTSYIDSGQYHLLYLDRNDGQGYKHIRSQKSGVVTSEGNTRCIVPWAISTTVSDVTTIKLKMISGKYNIGSGGTENGSAIQNITLAIMGAKR